MADIQPEITEFKSAVYGEDVRDAMVSLANKLNNEGDAVRGLAEGVVSHSAMFTRSLGRMEPLSVKLDVSETVAYRYQGMTRSNTQHSKRYALPPGCIEVSVTMKIAKNINIATFLDDTGAVLGFTDTFEDNVWTNDTIYTATMPVPDGATFIVCSNNEANIGTIEAFAQIYDLSLLATESMNGGGALVPLQGNLADFVCQKKNKTSRINGSVVFDCAGFSHLDIIGTDYVFGENINQYSFLNSDGDIIAYIVPVSDEQASSYTVFKSVPVPRDAEKVSIGVKSLVGSQSRQSTRYLNAIRVYGDASSRDGWTSIPGTIVGYAYGRDGRQIARTDGSVEFAASYGDVFEIEATSVANLCIYVFLDSSNNILIRFYDAGTEYNKVRRYHAVAPKGAVKMHCCATAGGNYTGNTTRIVARRRTTNGAKLSIIGDSISSFANMLPDGNAAYYTGSNASVNEVRETWWGRLIVDSGMSLCVNNSWSGSRVSNTAGDSSAMCMDRCQNLHDGQDMPDVIVVYGGVNDYLQAVPIGTWNGETQAIPTTGLNFRDAYALMLNKIHEAYPLAKVLCCTLPNCERDQDMEPGQRVGNLEVRDGQFLHWFNSAIRDIATLLNCEVVELNSCGINQYNISEYMGDYSATSNWGLHPNADGHEKLYMEIVKHI